MKTESKKNHFETQIICFLAIGSLCAYSLLSFALQTSNIYVNKSAYFSTYPNDATPSNDTYISQIELDKAWDITHGSDDICLGIADSGVSNVPFDLSVNLNTSLSTDCLNLSRSPFSDSVGHGTFVAGVAGAKGNNSTSRTGVMWNTSIVSLRVDSNNYSHLESPIAFKNAINYATINNIPIINFSGGFGSLSDASITDNQIEDLYEAISLYPGLIVCAAGNSGAVIGNNGSTLYPQMLDLDNILVVGSVGSNDYLKSYSNKSAVYVDVFAPTDITTISLASFGTSVFTHTSCSSPVVAGIAGLLKSINPNLTSIQIKNAILNNIDYVGDTYDNCSSHGRVNAYKAALSVLPRYSLGQTIQPVKPISQDECHFYKITAFPGSYTFSNSSSLNITTYLYSDIQDAPVASGSSNGSGTLFSYDFPNYGTYYLKVCSSQNSNTYSITTSANQHIHFYDYSYLWKSQNQHYAFCSCGLSQLRVHVVASGGNRCLLCGGPAWGGIINPLNSTASITYILNDSYIADTGNIVLGNSDYESFIIGSLIVDDIYNHSGGVQI